MTAIEPTEINLVEMLIQASREREAAARIPDCIDGAQQRLDQAKAAVLVTMRSAPQEPDDALHFVTTISQMAIAGRSPQEIAKALGKAQEPVAYDDDAERDLRIALWNALRRESIGQDKCYRIINATVAVLQAKAPETGEE